jgi:hypothetical protein
MGPIYLNNLKCGSHLFRQIYLIETSFNRLFESIVGNPVQFGTRYIIMPDTNTRLVCRISILLEK